MLLNNCRSRLASIEIICPNGVSSSYLNHCAEIYRISCKNLQTFQDLNESYDRAVRWLNTCQTNVLFFACRIRVNFDTQRKEIKIYLYQ